MSTRIPNTPRLVRGSPQFHAWRGVLPAADRLADRNLGRAITMARSSWVRELATPLGNVFVKTYEYHTWADRTRNFWRRTGPFTRSRAAREFDALSWLRGQGFGAPEPLAVLETRWLGFLVRATLVSAAFPGETAERLLPQLSCGEQIDLAKAIGTLVGALHRLGFRDRNLDLRNLLAQRTETGWQVAKIDSPRYRLRRPGRREDRQSRADWQRLTPQLAAFGLDSVARAAALEAGPSTTPSGDQPAGSRKSST